MERSPLTNYQLQIESLKCNFSPTESKSSKTCSIFPWQLPNTHLFHRAMRQTQILLTKLNGKFQCENKLDNFS